jgi:hypothetical protein
MEALGDIKQLQHEQLRKGQGIDYQTKPPIGLPTSADGKQVDLLPGGITFFDTAEPSTGSRQMFEARIDLNHLLADIQDVRGRINSAFYADLFLMLSQLDRERHDRDRSRRAPRGEDAGARPGARAAALRAAEPDGRDVLRGSARSRRHPAAAARDERPAAQHRVRVGAGPGAARDRHRATDRFVGNLGVVASFKPDVLDKFDSDKWADIYSDQLGVDPELIVPLSRLARSCSTSSPSPR